MQTIMKINYYLNFLKKINHKRRFFPLKKCCIRLEKSKLVN